MPSMPRGKNSTDSMGNKTPSNVTATSGQVSLTALDKSKITAGAGSLGLSLAIGMTAGVAVSANMDIGGFDTHSDNDNQQERQLMILARGLDYLFNTINAMGLTNQVYVVVGSDFGRDSGGGVGFKPWVHGPHCHCNPHGLCQQ